MTKPTSVQIASVPEEIREKLKMEALEETRSHGRGGDWTELYLKKLKHHIDNEAAKDALLRQCFQLNFTAPTAVAFHGGVASQRLSGDVNVSGAGGSVSMNNDSNQTTTNTQSVPVPSPAVDNPSNKPPSIGATEAASEGPLPATSGGSLRPRSGSLLSWEEEEENAQDWNPASTSATTTTTHLAKTYPSPPSSPESTLAKLKEIGEEQQQHPLLTSKSYMVLEKRLKAYFPEACRGINAKLFGEQVKNLRERGTIDPFLARELHWVSHKRQLLNHDEFGKKTLEECGTNYPSFLEVVERCLRWLDTVHQVLQERRAKEQAESRIAQRDTEIGRLSVLLNQARGTPNHASGRVRGRGFPPRSPGSAERYGISSPSRSGVRQYDDTRSPPSPGHSVGGYSSASTHGSENNNRKRRRRNHRPHSRNSPASVDETLEERYGYYGPQVREGPPPPQNDHSPPDDFHYTP